MWFLHIIPKNSHSSVVYSRLRPAQTYRLRSSHSRSSTTSNADSVFLEVDLFTAEEVVNVRSRPTVHLKRGNVPIKIDNEIVNQDDIILFDKQMIRINNSETQYRLYWEEVGIYHIKSHDRDAHERLIEYGCKYGFHIVKELGLKTTTHYYISEGADVEPTKYLTFALLQNLIFVTDYWLTGLDVLDKGFNIQDFNEKTEPLRIENQGPIRKTAILGRDTRRATLFRGLEFWFFHDLQFKEFSMYIKLAGGKSRRSTFEEGLHTTIVASTLFVEPPTETEAFIPLRAKFHQEAEVERCVLDWEIIASILYCSTNFTCNPQADIIKQMSPNDPYYASLPASMKSVPIKEEPMSQDLSDTVPANTYPANEQDYTAPTEIDDTVPANTVHAEDHDTMPANTVPADTVPTGQNDDDMMDMDSKIIVHDQPSCAVVETDDDPHNTNNSNNQEVEPTVKSEPLNDDEQENSLAEFDFESQPMDVDNFFDDIFKQQEEQKRQFQSHQKEREKKEARRLRLQQQEQEEARRIQLQQQEQEEKEAHRTQLQQQELQEQTRRLQQENDQEEQARRLEQQENNDYEYQQKLSEERRRVQEEYEQDMERRRREMQQEDGIENNPNNQESNSSAATGVDVQQIGEFTKVQYAPLIVRPRPPLFQQQERTNSSGGVNYKRFKKVRQFQPQSLVNVVCLVTNSQRVRDSNYNNSTSTRVQSASQFDPDIAITVGRRRRR